MITIKEMLGGRLIAYTSIPGRVTINVYDSFGKCSNVIDLSSEQAKALAAEIVLLAKEANEKSSNTPES